MKPAAFQARLPAGPPPPDSARVQRPAPRFCTVLKCLVTESTGPSRRSGLTTAPARSGGELTQEDGRHDRCRCIAHRGHHLHLGVWSARLDRADLRAPIVSSPWACFSARCSASSNQRSGRKLPWRLADGRGSPSRPRSAIIFRSRHERAGQRNHHDPTTKLARTRLTSNTTAGRLAPWKPPSGSAITRCAVKPTDTEEPGMFTSHADKSSR